MSALEDMYNNSKAPTVVDARKIPLESTHFMDVNSKFQKEFTPGEQPMGATTYTPLALDYFDQEIKNLVPTEGSQEFSPTKPYYTPGQK